MSVIWGIPYLLIKIAVDGVSAPVLVFARTAIGAAVLIPLALSRCVDTGHQILETGAGLRLLRNRGGLADALRRRTAHLQLAHRSAHRGLPIVAAVLDRLTGGERRLGGKRIAGLAVGFAGVAVLAGPEITGGSAWPVVEVLLVATCYAIAPLVAARHLADVQPCP